MIKNIKFSINQVIENIKNISDLGKKTFIIKYTYEIYRSFRTIKKHLIDVLFQVKPKYKPFSLDYIQSYSIKCVHFRLFPFV